MTKCTFHSITWPNLFNSKSSTKWKVTYYVAKFFASETPQRKCISLECGLQNGTLAVFVATQLFQDIVYIIPTAAYALIMFVTSLVFVFIVRKSN